MAVEESAMAVDLGYSIAKTQEEELARAREGMKCRAGLLNN
jgi:hypothetical protein